MSRLANAIAIIRSSLIAKKQIAKIQANKKVILVLNKFQNRGLINGYTYFQSAKGGTCKVYLKYDDNFDPIITYMKMLPENFRTSWRYSYKNLKNVFINGGLDVLLSTDKGFLFCSEIVPNRLKIGGKAVLIISIY